MNDPEEAAVINGEAEEQFDGSRLVQDGSVGGHSTTGYVCACAGSWVSITWGVTLIQGWPVEYSSSTTYGASS